MKKFDVRHYIHESNLIEGFDDGIADSMSVSAWDWLTRQPILALDEKIICELQGRITKFQSEMPQDWKGAFRQHNVRVGTRVCPDWQEVEKGVRNLIRIWTFTNPRTWHVEFEKIHPFADGNGRTGRMLMWWQQYHRGELPLLILDSQKQSYYRWFS